MVSIINYDTLYNKKSSLYRDKLHYDLTKTFYAHRLLHRKTNTIYIRLSKVYEIMIKDKNLKQYHEFIQKPIIDIEKYPELDLVHIEINIE